MTSTSPTLAVILNPLNTEARIRALDLRLTGQGERPSDLAALARRAEDIIRLSPADARAYSLLAKVRLLQHREEEAEALFARALKEAPTERVALLYMLRKATREKRFDEAVNHLDVLLRRWPEAYEQLKGYFVYLASLEAARPLLEKKLGQRPPWRSTAFKELIATPQGRPFLRQLLSHEHDRGMKGDEWERVSLLRALLREDRVAEAYRTFIFLLDDEERRELGYVFDPMFRLGPRDLPFTWRIGHESFVEVEYPHYDEHGVGGLALSFHDAPTRLGSIYQRLALPPGHYVLRVRASAYRLQTPRDLYWRLSCEKANVRKQERARIVIKPGDYRDRAYTADFTIPPACIRQILILQTALLAPTWRARFRGRLIFHEIGIIRTDTNR